MHNSPLEDGQIKVIRCPYCGYESRKTLAWTHGRAKLQCAGCGEEFSLNNNKAREAFDRFRRKLTNMVGRM
jgi:DNA-directed RNA polymerase subunit RPC12/RpoP